MFERHTEKARRAVFFARYEASQFGSEFITTEHLLLGILRDDKELVRQVLPKVDFESARVHVEKRAEASKIKYPVSVDLPLADDAKRALTYGMEEADRLKSRHIGTEHLLLGLIRDKEFPSAKLLDQFGASLESLRKRVDALPVRPNLPATQSFAQRVLESSREYRRTDLTPSTVEIHGRKWNVEGVRSLVARLKSHPWYWERKQWQARDVVYEKNGKLFSFDTSLAQDSSKFLLVKGGWKKDDCAICRWELSESEDVVHGIGFTNGRDWVCEECYYRFITGEFFSSAYSDIT
jgi:hypothetical protein